MFAAVEVRGNCCTSLDFADVIADTRYRSLLYLDPPYYVKGNDLYQHGFTVDDHRRLADALRETEHAWVLSYDDCPEIRRLYEWAYAESLDVNYSITGCQGQDHGRASLSHEVRAVDLSEAGKGGGVEYHVNRRWQTCGDKPERLLHR